VSSVKPKTSYQQKSTRPESRHHPAADEFIKNIKKQVNIIIPPRDYEDEPFLNSLAIDLAETIYKQEIEKFTRELVEQAINEEYNQVYLYQRPIFNHIFEETTSEIIRQLVAESVDEHRKQVEKFQANEIKKVAKEKLVTNLMLDHMLTKVAQHGRVMAENEDINKLMDGMILDVLLFTSMDVTKSRNKTLSNYPIKKFHMNSFMNVALDILVAELSSNLEEDMKELENYEQITSKI
jgi:predicted Zn-dependent protease with MMP-like domain